MKQKKIIFFAFLLVLITVGISGANVIDVKEFNTGYFCPDDTQTYNSPYYRWASEDWGWQQSAIAGTFTTAKLWIAAWDVDAPYEVDNIYARNNNGDQVLLGSLAGLNNEWGYTTFALDLNMFDTAINNGLNLWMDIDSNNGNWAVTLSKSVLTLDGGSPPPPQPGPTPEPATILLLGFGIAGLVGLNKKRKK